MGTSRTAIDPDIADEVAAFLRAHPGFLCERPELYRVLTPPQRFHHDEPILDHMTAMIRAERTRNALSHDGMAAAGRAAIGLAARVHEAVIALMRAPDPVEFVAEDLPGLLGIDAASLCMENPLPQARPLPPGTVERLLRGREVLSRQAPTETRLLHGEAAALARGDALVRVRQPGGPDALLVLAVRDRELLRRDGGIGSLSFLGRALSAALDRAA